MADAPTEPEVATLVQLTRRELAALHALAKRAEEDARWHHPPGSPAAGSYYELARKLYRALSRTYQETP